MIAEILETRNEKTYNAVLDYHGCHTVKLATPVDVEDCAVVITYSSPAKKQGSFESI